MESGKFHPEILYCTAAKDISGRGYIALTLTGSYFCSAAKTTTRAAGAVCHDVLPPASAKPKERFL
jgi:hypothetical protein